MAPPSKPPGPPTPEHWPGAWPPLLAPRSLSHSKLRVPNAKLLPLAKKTKAEGMGVGAGRWVERKEKAKLRLEGISATQNELEDWSGLTGQIKTLA